MMMKNTFLIILALFMGFAACKKDEDTEPEDSMKDKLCRQWKLEKLFLNDVDITESNNAGITEYKSDGSVSLTYIDPDFGEINYEAQWHFSDDNKYLEVSEYVYNGKTTIGNFLPIFMKELKNNWTSYEILSLSTEILILKNDMGNGNVYRIESKSL